MPNSYLFFITIIKGEIADFCTSSNFKVLGATLQVLGATSHVLGATSNVLEATLTYFICT
jgi:hypothetical protein